MQHKIYEFQLTLIDVCVCVSVCGVYLNVDLCYNVLYTQNVSAYCEFNEVQTKRNIMRARCE